MPTSSPDRFALYEMMRDAWGEPLATALTGRLPPMDLSDIATKQDVEHSSVLLRGEMSELRGEMRGEMSELRGEMRGEMSELRGEMKELRAELRGEMTELRGEMSELRGEMSELRAEFRASSRHTIITIVAAAVSIWLTFYLPQVL